MSRYFIDSIKYGCAVGGMSCSGWQPGPDIYEIKVIPDGDKPFFLSLAMVDGMPQFFKNDESPFELMITERDDPEAWEKLNNSLVASGMSFEEAYEDCFEDDDELLAPCKLIGFLAGMRIAESEVCTRTINHYLGGNEDLGKILSDFIPSIVSSEFRRNGLIPMKSD